MDSRNQSKACGYKRYSKAQLQGTQPDADTEIPAVPFEEAMNFLKSKVPMTKAEWIELEPKLRFRAFTVAQLGSADVVNKAREILIKSFEKGGESYSGTWEQLKKVVNTNALGIKPGYWENVFRTNTQSAYIAGKVQQYENTGVAAYQLLVIEDSRTSKICRHLLTSSGYGMIISVDHPFWKKYGFPPYHFQCRTSIRAVYPSEVGKRGNMVENPTMKSLSKFKVQEGFGGNPLDKESWWRMTKDMVKRAAEYDLFNIIEEQAHKNGLYNFGMHLVRGSELFENPEIDYYAKGAFFARPNPDEIAFAKKLEEDGNSWYFTPREKKIQNMKSPDGIFNGHIADMKNMESMDIRRLAQRIGEADQQKCYAVCLNLTVKPKYSKKEAIDFIKKTVLESKYVDKDKGLIIIENIKEVCLCYENDLIYIKK